MFGDLRFQDSRIRHFVFSWYDLLPQMKRPRGIVNFSFRISGAVFRVKGLRFRFRLQV